MSDLPHTPNNRQRIMQQLVDGRCHAGPALAGRLGISRAAVWKHIQQLQAHGVDIRSTPGKGYCLHSGVELLDAQQISQALSADIRERMALECLWQTESTNDHLLQQVQAGMTPPRACLAEQQQAGRGRQGRPWVSPFGVNLYLSFYWRFSLAPVELGGLSLAVAVSITERLAAAGIDGLSIKWPNDIYLNDGKLGGILIDLSGEAAGPSQVVIGLGLNYRMPMPQRAAVDQAVADLTDATAPHLSGRNELAAWMIEALYRSCEEFAAHGFAPFQQRWARWDRVHECTVDLHMGHERIAGTACGVDERGALRLSTVAGLRHFASGEVSLRV